MTQDKIKPEAEHRFFQSALRLERFITDFTSKLLVKRRCLLSYTDYRDYLLIPHTYKKPDGTHDLERFERLVYHAHFPQSIVQSGLKQALGACFKQTPKIELPDQLRYLEQSLEPLARKCMKELLISGRFALFSDIGADGKPIILFYDSKNIPNWSDDETFFTLEESTDDQVVRIIVSTDENGNIVTTRYKGNKDVERYIDTDRRDTTTNINTNGISGSMLSNVRYVEDDQVNRTTYKGKSLQIMPVQYVEDVPILESMAELVLKGFQLSAAYYSMLDTLATGKMVLSTDRTFLEVAGGHEFGLMLEKGGKAELLQMTSDGAGVQRTEIDALFDAARAEGIELITAGANKASAENLYIQTSSKQLKITEPAQVVSEKITTALRVCASFIGINEEDITFKLNVSLMNPPIDIPMLQELRTGVENGYVKQRDYLAKLHENKLISIEKDDDGVLLFDKYIAENMLQNLQLAGD